jgi:hypothetical protein
MKDLLFFDLVVLEHNANSTREWEKADPSLSAQDDSAAIFRIATQSLVGEA